MELVSPEVLLLLCAVAFLAGWVDAIAGGGGLLVVPVLLWAGIPGAQALGTNKLQSSFGTAVATLNYLRNGWVELKDLKWAVVCAFVGSALGAVLIQSVHTEFLNRIIPVALILVAIYFFIMPPTKSVHTRAHLSAAVFAVTVALGVGFYDGLIGPGTGSFFAAAFVALRGFPLVKATAHTKVLNLTSNVAALVFFSLGGNVLWSVGLTMAVGQMLGGYLGSHMAMLHGSRIIRPLLVAVSLAISLKLILSEL